MPRDELPIVTQNAIAKTVDTAFIKLSALQAEQFDALQHSLTLLQREIDVLNERVAVLTDRFIKHLEDHE